MNKDDPNTCMYCGELIADTSAPVRFCSQACFDTLVKKVKRQWDQRYREARANGNEARNGAVREVKPLSEIMRARRPAKPAPSLMLRPLDMQIKDEDAA